VRKQAAKYLNLYRKWRFNLSNRQRSSETNFIQLSLFWETEELLFGHHWLAIQERRITGAALIALSLSRRHDATIEQRKNGWSAKQIL